MAKALASNGAAKVYIVGRRKEVVERAAKESVNHRFCEKFSHTI